MDDGTETTVGAEALQTWAKLVEQQSHLFINTAEECERLQARVGELEQELAVWKMAVQNYKSEKEELSLKAARLERNVISLKDDNAMVFCLIDGDGHLFSQELVNQGQTGGRKAAQLLNQGISNHISMYEEEPALARAQITVTIFCNLVGLEDTYDYYKLCSREDFRAFILGFNQAAPLINIIDAGHGKEAADSKIKENLRVYSKFPQTARIIFGGAHDNGYTTTLTTLENEGLLHKVVLLRGYKEIAAELRTLRLPLLQIDNIFMEHKLPAKDYKWAPDALDLGYNGQPASAPETSGPVDSTTLMPGKHSLGPCNLFYVSPKGCPFGLRCKFGHDYTVSAEGLEVLRKNIRGIPCPLLNKGKPCPDGDSCLYGHICPRAPKCYYFTQGKCKFVGKDAHPAGTVPPITPKKATAKVKKAKKVKASGSVVEGNLSPQSVASSELPSSSNDRPVYFPTIGSYHPYYSD